MNPRVRNRWLLVGLFVLFLMPVLLAIWLQSNPGRWQPVPTANKGELIAPAVNLPELASTGEGGFRALITAQPCDETCMQNIEALSRVRLALNKDMEQLHLVHHGTSATVASAPFVQTVDVGQVLGEFPDLEDSAVVLVDARGFAFLRYPAPLEPADVLDDLQRLLRNDRTQ